MTEKLEENALGLLSTVALTAAYMGPALSVYALFGPMTGMVGTGVGFVMAVGFLAILPSAISFGMLAREIPSAGGVYSWTRVALGDPLGRWVGLTTVAYYTVCLVFPPIVFGQFWNELLGQLGLPTSSWTWLLGALCLLVTAGGVTYRGIAVSSHLALALLLTEVAVVVGLAVTFAVSAVAHGTFSWTPLTPGACRGGWSGLFAALPLALISMACDAAVPASEETRNARWTIPVAVVLTCVVIGVWYVFGFSAFALAARPDEIAAASDQAFASVITPLAGRVWGPFKLLVTLTAMTAAMGGFIPGATAASRVMYAMARDGNLPAGLKRLHPRFRTPWSALHVAFAISALGAIPAALRIGPDQTIAWWGGALGWFVAVVYVFVNVANTVYHWRFCRQRFSVVANLLVPVLGVAAQLTVIWQSVIVEPWHSSLGRRSQLFIVAVTVASALYARTLRTRSKSALASSR